MLRYFGSREEIYLELATRQWREWAEALTIALETDTQAASVTDIISASLVERPLFCELMSQVWINLEHNVSVAVSLEFKATSSTLADTLAQRVAAAQSTLTPEESRELIDGAVMLAAAVWVVANPSPKVLSVYAQDPELRHGRIVFATTYPRLLAAMAAGLPTLR